MRDEFDITEFRTEILLFNPRHDKLGRFATRVGGAISRANTAEQKTTRQVWNRGEEAEKAIVSKAMSGLKSDRGKAITKGVAKGAAKTAIVGGLNYALTGTKRPGVWGSFGLMMNGAVNIAAGITEKKSGQAKLAKYEAGDYSASYAKKAKLIGNEQVMTGTMNIADGLTALGMGAAFMAISIKKGDWGGSSAWSRYDSEYTRKSYSYAREHRTWEQGRTQSRSTYWPPGAPQDDFKKMYTSVARKQHPDVGGSSDTMKIINKAYTNKDWSTIEGFYKKLSEFFNTILLSESKRTDNDVVHALALLYRVFKDALADGVQFMGLPEDVGIPDAPRYDSKVWVDRPFMQFIVDILEAK